MNYRLAFFLAFVFLLFGCNEKTEKKVGPRTPEIVTEKTLPLSGAQTLPDTVLTLGNLSWHSNIKQAFTLAKEQNKDVIVMVGEESCRWCIKMKENTLMDARVQEQMEKYILVSIKRSNKAVIKYVPDFDGNIPSFFFMNDKKEVMDSVVGYFKEDNFLEYIKEIEELLGSYAK